VAGTRKTFFAPERIRHLRLLKLSLSKHWSGVRKDRLIFIPPDARAEPLARFPASARLRHVFEFRNFQLAADLHGVTFPELRRYRNCGRKTIDELRALVRTIQRLHQPADVQETPASVAGEAFNIPPNARDLELADLPLSLRLEGVLRQKGACRLGDLHGVSIADILRIRNCGGYTIAELEHLIARAAAGEFVADADLASNPAESVRFLDALIDALPDRNEEILLLRLGGKRNEIPALHEVGARFALTRGRVSQIVFECVDEIRKHGSRRLWIGLERIERFCCENVCPLTPVLLEQWLGKQSVTEHFMPAFYVRLLGRLKPAIPAWPEGQDAFATKGRGDEIESALEAALRDSSRALPLPRALRQVRARGSLHNIETAEFLAALKQSRRLKVEFPQPERPVVRLHRGV
jgi:hypothetical protein